MSAENLIGLGPRAEEDAREWERRIREEARKEGMEEMRRILEPRHQAELEAVKSEKETIAMQLEEMKEIRERDNEQMEELKAQVKEKDDRVNQLVRELIKCETKMGKVCQVYAQFGSWMTRTLETDDTDSESSVTFPSLGGTPDDDDEDELSEDSEASSEPVTSKKRRLSFSSTSSSPPNLLPEFNHDDMGGHKCECGVGYDSQEQLKEHLSFMESGRMYACLVCKDQDERRRYPKRSGLKIHMKNKHNIMIYGGSKNCDFCGVAFPTVDKLEQHLIKNPRTRKLICPAIFVGLRTQEEGEGIPAKLVETE